MRELSRTGWPKIAIDVDVMFSSVAQSLPAEFLGEIAAFAKTIRNCSWRAEPRNDSQVETDGVIGRKARSPRPLFARIGFEENRFRFQEIPAAI